MSARYEAFAALTALQVALAHETRLMCSLREAPDGPGATALRLDIAIAGKRTGAAFDAWISLVRKPEWELVG